MQGQLIGERLKAARKLRNVETRAHLARLVDKPRFGERVLGMIERNERAAQQHEIEWLAEALDLEPGFFTDPDRAGETQLDRIENELHRQGVLIEASAVNVLLEAVQQLVRDQNRLLMRQSEILERIEDAIGRERSAADREEAATERLLQAVGAASRALRGETQDPG